MFYLTISFLKIMKCLLQMNGIGGNMLKKERQSPLRNICFSGQMKESWIEP